MSAAESNVFDPTETGPAGYRAIPGEARSLTIVQPDGVHLVSVLALVVGLMFGWIGTGSLVSHVSLIGVACAAIGLASCAVGLPLIVRRRLELTPQSLTTEFRVLGQPIAHRRRVGVTGLEIQHGLLDEGGASVDLLKAVIPGGRPVLLACEDNLPDATYRLACVGPLQVHYNTWKIGTPSMNRPPTASKLHGPETVSLDQVADEIAPGVVWVAVIGARALQVPVSVRIHRHRAPSIAFGSD